MRRWRADCAFAALAMRARSEVSERVAGRRMMLPDIVMYHAGSSPDFLVILCAFYDVLCLGVIEGCYESWSHRGLP